MRILHTEASSGWGGQEIRILTESQVFQRHGHELLVAADADSQIAKNAAAYGIRAFPIKLKKKRFADLFALRKLINQQKPDVINCHSSTDHWLSALARLTLKHKFAIVRTRHISAPVHRNKPTRWLYNQGSEAVMTTGVSIREMLIIDDFVDANSVFSVPTGIDTDVFKPGDKQKQRNLLKLPSEHYIFGICATLRSWKGHSDLIQAFNLLNNPSSSLVIVGDGPQLDNLKKLVSETRYPHNIHLVGNQANVLPYLQSMDCFALPSYANEGVPQALLQAMAVGLPVISCPIGGIPEALQGYAQGSLTPTQNPQALSEMMRKQLEQNSAAPSRHTPFTLEGMYTSVLSVFELAAQKCAQNN
ncbi:MAG: glycosyltransferase [Bdellovibrio sp.]|nr:glycosyltransferase [Methylotenera sp.]